MANDTPLLQVFSLSKSFGGIQAVRDISFKLDAGQMLALIGPNGAGKTTCFNMLHGQLPPDHGKILLHGQLLNGLPSRKITHLGVGRTFQITAVFPSMTVGENIQTALFCNSRIKTSWYNRFAVWGGRQYKSDALALLEQVGLSTHFRKPASKLAYGDLKRLELAMVLAGKPSLLLLDEPTAGMAIRERATLMGLIKGIVQERHLAVLFTEHDMDIVFRHADRVLVMARGEMVAEDTPTVIRAHPRVREIYLGTPG